MNIEIGFYALLNVFSGLHQVYFFPHEPDNLLAPEMVEYFVKKMAIHDVIIRGPKLKDENEGSQISLF